MKHSTIIPLIGGEIIASSDVFGDKPEYILSYDVFKHNESHLLNYWNNEIPYYVLDKGDSAPKIKIDVVSSVCPCAGLSQYHNKAGEDNPNNQWMEKTANYILSEVKPKVFWGENAPALPGKIGEFMLKKLRNIGLQNGYSMSVYLTKNINHGVPQFRKRAFYFFWNKKEFGERCPLINYFARPHKKIEDVIIDNESNFQMEPINSKTPSKDDPYYRYLLEEIHGGVTHREFFDILETKNVRGNDVESLIEIAGHDYNMVGNWMEKNNYTREIEKCKRKFIKLKNNGNIMRRGTIVPKNYIGAFVGHYPNVLTHPHEDRYVTYREAMNIMGLPRDFELLNPRKSINHICQNVHYDTSKDMAMEIKSVFAGDRKFVETDFVFQSNLNKTHEDWSNRGKDTTLESFFG